MQQILPVQLKNLAKACPFPLYAVGGACRDFLAGLEPKERDWDICAPVPFELFARVAEEQGWRVAAVFARTGSVKAEYNGLACEFTSFRSDVYAEGGHSPSEVKFTYDMAEDARRRDFTCNAVYYDICGGQFVDPLGGAVDISAKLLRPCISAEKLFVRDALRVLRLARFCGELGFSPVDGCMPAAASAVPLLPLQPPALVWRELKGIFGADEKYGLAGGAQTALGCLHAVGALRPLFGAESASEDRVAAAVRSAGFVPSRLRLAAFMCALGLTSERLNPAWPIPKACASCLSALLSCAYSSNCSSAFVRDNRTVVEDAAAVLRAAGAEERANALCRAFDRLKKSGVPLDISELAVGGNELLAAGIPARQVGGVLNKLLSDCADGGLKNEKEQLIRRAVQYRT